VLSVNEKSKKIHTVGLHVYNYGSFIVLVLVFYFRCATAEIKHRLVSVLFQFYFYRAGAITDRRVISIKYDQKPG